MFLLQPEISFSIPSHYTFIFLLFLSWGRHETLGAQVTFMEKKNYDDGGFNVVPLILRVKPDSWSFTGYNDLGGCGGKTGKTIFEFMERF